MTRPYGQPIRLAPDDAERYVPLRRRMLVESPWAFGADPDDDRGSDPANLREMLGKAHYAIFAITEAGQGSLVAAATIIYEPGRPMSATDHTSRQ